MKRLGSLGGIIVHIKVNASYDGSFLDSSNIRRNLNESNRKNITCNMSVRVRIRNIGK
jgi:hypothetical protein